MATQRQWPFPSISTSVLSYTNNRSTSPFQVHKTRESPLHPSFHTATLQPRELDTKEVNKIFVAKFIDNDSKVVLGSKDGTLQLVDLDNGKRFQISGSSKESINNAQEDDSRAAHSRTGIPHEKAHKMRLDNRSDSSHSIRAMRNTQFNRLDAPVTTRPSSSLLRIHPHERSATPFDPASNNHDRMISSSPILFGPPPASSPRRSQHPLSRLQGPFESSLTPVPDEAVSKHIPPLNYVQINSGIYDIALNQSKTLLAANDSVSNVAVVYDMPSFTPKLLLEHHKDAIFSMAYLNENVLATGSRDTSIAIWNFNVDATRRRLRPNRSQDFQNVDLVKPVCTLETFSKVRVIKENKRRGEFASLQVAGQVKLWSATTLQLQRSVQLEKVEEPVAMALDDRHGLYAVGDVNNLSLIDPRMSNGLVKSFESLDEGWGVRSLAFNKEVLTVGGGYGKISFYDLRAQNFVVLPIERTERVSLGVGRGMSALPSDQTQVLETGFGWLKHDHVLLEGFADHDIRHAVYTLQYDCTGTKMLTGGGPLQLGLTGSYAAVWS